MIKIKKAKSSTLAAKCKYNDLNSNMDNSNYGRFMRHLLNTHAYQLDDI